MSQLPVYILAGGRSSRFGSDKARAVVDQQAVIICLKQSLERAGGHVTIVADRSDRFADMGLDSIVDLRAAAGPLAGLETALKHRLATAGEGWILVTNGDLVRWSPAWTQCLSAAASADFDAIIFADDYPQPLPGLYHTRLLPVIQAQFARQHRSLQKLLETCCNRTKALESLDDCPRNWSFNTPQQLGEIVARLQKLTEGT